MVESGLIIILHLTNVAGEIHFHDLHRKYGERARNLTKDARVACSFAVFGTLTQRHALAFNRSFLSINDVASFSMSGNGCTSTVIALVLVSHGRFPSPHPAANP